MIDTLSVELTERQKQVLDLIKHFIKTEGIPPTRQNLADQFGCCTNNITGHLKALQQKGVIKLLKDTARGIKVCDLETK